MSELTNCKFCKQPVATNAQTCPHCGGVNPVRMNDLYLGILIIIFIGALYGFLSAN